jgi:putative transport protein
MFDMLLDLLRAQPIAAVFLTLALGTLLGRLGFRGLHLGTVPATLLVGVLVGQANVHLTGEHKTFFLFLFLFATGYAVGPQFFSGLRRNGAKLALFSSLVALSAVVTAYAAAVMMDWDAGTSTGLLAGATTTSLLVGIAGDAINAAGLDAEVAARLTANVAMAYAVTYLFGAGGTAYFLVAVGFRMLDRDMAGRCKEYEKELGGGHAAGTFNAYQNWSIRAYRLAGISGGVAPPTIGALESHLAGRDIPVHVLRYRDEDGLHDAGAAVPLRPGMVVAVGMPLRSVTHAPERLGPEVADPELLDFPVNVRRAVATNERFLGQRLQVLRTMPEFEGIGLRRLLRSGLDLPVLPNTVVERGDVLEITGTREQLQAAIPAIGRPQDDGIRADIAFLTGAMFLGMFAGMLKLMMGRIPVTLGMGGGILVLGLLAGWLHSRVPRIGAIPASSVWLLQHLGIGLFIAIVGISSSPGFIIGLKEKGFQLFLAGVVVSLVPTILGLLLGRFVFRFHPVITLGATCGARTEAAALGVVQDALKSQTPALSFSVPFAVANVVLTSFTILMVSLLL